MKTKIIFISIISSTLTILTSCEHDYACESYDTNSKNYYCFNFSDQEICETGSKYTISKYYDGKTCEEIGYTDPYSNILYSPYGHTVKGSGSTIDISGGSSGGGGGGSCTSSYNGPSTTTYPQAAPFCYQAWYYRCSAGLSLTSQQVSTNCSTYKIFREDNPNLPVCNFCQ